MGWDPPEEEELTIDASDLSIEAQQALQLFQILPDKIDSMGGIWLGKDFSGLLDIMEIYSIYNPREVLELLNICIDQASKYYEERRKLTSKK